MLGRFVCFHEYIALHKLVFDHCYFLDIRDVFFQSNVFEKIKPGTYIKAFTSDKTFDRDNTEQSWILRSYGPDTLASLMDKRVLCAGTTLASFAGAQQYLKLMVNASERFKMRYFGLDEAIHNVVIYNDMYDDAEIGINRTSEVQTMHLQERFWFNENWQIINDDGEVCPILHQYDRHDLLRKCVFSINGFDDPFLPEFWKMKGIFKSRSRTAKHLIKLFRDKR